MTGRDLRSDGSPFDSERHAEFIHNELPGVVGPEPVRDRMTEAGDDGPAEGAAIARETAAAAGGGVQGIYLIPAFGRYDAAADLVKQINGEAYRTRAREGGWRQ